MEHSDQLLPLFLGSAAIGALVSSCITLIGRWRERKSRRQELVLSEAVKLAQADMGAALQVAIASKRSTSIAPMYEYVARHHKWLKHLLETGEMHPDYKPADERPN